MYHIGYIGLVLIFLRLRLRIRKKISPKRGTLSFELTISLNEVRLKSPALEPLCHSVLVSPRRLNYPYLRDAAHLPWRQGL
jgi:hypothetical protein